MHYLVSKYEKNVHDFKLIVFDLYDIIMDLLIQEGFLEICEEFEKDERFTRDYKGSQRDASYGRR